MICAPTTPEKSANLQTVYATHTSCLFVHRRSISANVISRSRAAYAALSSECAGGDRARHDKLLALVDKMLALTPKLRAAKSDTERATLHNAVSATDRQIDALVYELYGLTPEEIALVEGGGS